MKYVKIGVHVSKHLKSTCLRPRSNEELALLSTAKLQVHDGLVTLSLPAFKSQTGRS